METNPEVARLELKPKLINPAVKEELLITCGKCGREWPAEETYNAEGRRILKFAILCPQCNIAEHLEVWSNLDDLSAGVFLFADLETGLEHPQEIRFTDGAREFTEGATLDIRLEQPTSAKKIQPVPTAPGN